MLLKAMEFKGTDATVPPLFVRCFIWVVASLGKDSLIYLWYSTEAFSQMVLEPLQSDNREQQKVINKKQHAQESLTTELQVSQEDKWHHFHRNTVGLDRKVEYWWKLEGAFGKGEYSLRPSCEANALSMSCS